MHTPPLKLGLLSMVEDKHLTSRRNKTSSCGKRGSFKAPQGGQREFQTGSYETVSEHIFNNVYSGKFVLILSFCLSISLPILVSQDNCKISSLSLSLIGILETIFLINALISKCT